MTSFRVKLRNLIITSFGTNQNNLEENFEKTIIDTQRKIKNDTNSEIATSLKKIQKIKFENNFEQPPKIKGDLKNNNSSLKRNNKNRIYKKINFENLDMSNLTLNINSKKDKDDINKKYKNLYNKSYMNLNNKVYNKNKAYLNYKDSNNNLLNKYNKINIIKTNNINNCNYNNNNILKHKNSTSYKYISKNLNSNDNCNLKDNNFSSNINYFELYDNLIHKNNAKENDIFITKNKKRISSSIKKKINLIIGENNLEKLSHKNNISKLPRTLTSELYQFDYQYYNDISPITKFIYLNNEKNKKCFNINNKYNNKNHLNHLLN